MSNGDNANPPQSQPAAPASAGGAGAAGPILPESPDYPPYLVQFKGATMVDVNTGAPVAMVRVTGPHTFALMQPGGGQLRVSLTRNPTDPGGPNLSIEFS